MYSKQQSKPQGPPSPGAIAEKENIQNAKRIAHFFGVTPERTPMERAGWAVPAELHKKKLHPGQSCPGCAIALRVEAQLHEAIKEERLSCANLVDDIAGEYESQACVWAAEKIRERKTGL
jgi:hypothetical protein